MDKAALEQALKDGMQAATEKPGRYGGRYVARQYDRAAKADRYLVLADDDPDLYRDDESLDVLAQCTPKTAYGIGRARHWINEDGTISL